MNMDDQPQPPSAQIDSAEESGTSPAPTGPQLNQSSVDQDSPNFIN
jgi:hypothetical protein